MKAALKFIKHISRYTYKSEERDIHSLESLKVGKKLHWRKFLGTMVLRSTVGADKTLARAHIKNKESEDI